MLIKYKERYRILFRAITLAVFCLLVFNDIAFALSPKLRLTQPEFEEEYLLRSAILVCDITHNYISTHVNAGLYRTDGGIEIKGVKGLLKNIGQIAQVDVDSINKVPVIHVDTDYFNNETVVGFEKEKVYALMNLWQLKQYEYKDMTAWIVDYMDKPDPDVSGMTSRQKADEIHRMAHQKYPGIDRLYERIKTKYKKAKDRGQSARAESLLNLASMHAFYKEAGYILDRDDKKNINFTAHEKDVSEVASAVVPAEREQVIKSWIEQNLPELKGKTLVTLGVEGNIPEFRGYEARDANTKGGFGAYYGDKLEGMAGIGMNAIGMQIGYSHRRKKDGKKVRVSYVELIKKGILRPVLVGDDALTVRAWDEDPEARGEDEEDRYNPNPKVRVEVYKLNRGGAADYLFMSKVFDELYPADKVRRFTQEIVFGKAVYAFMKKINLIPDILHLNEAHTVVAAAQMRADEAYNGTAIIYTNHTLVPAGLEVFPPEWVQSNVNRMMYVIGLPKKKAEKFRSIFLRPDGVVDFCYAAMKLADVINGVSKEHALATKRFFQAMYGGEFNADVVGVLNGSGQSWKSDKLLDLEAAGRVLSKEAAWRIHEYGKEEAFAEIEKRSGIKLDPKKLTAWIVRRLVDYKSQYPILKFIVHLMTADTTRTFTRDELKEIWFRDLTNFRQDYDRNYLGTRDIAESVLDKIFHSGAEKVNGLGMQVVVGWPPPAYQEFWADEFYKWMDLPDLKGRFAVVSSDIDMLKMQAIGADICISMFRPLEEACGTSDQRTALNFGLNIAPRGAGPAEWMEEYDEAKGSGSGFLTGSYTKEGKDGLEPDNEKFYKEAPADIFEKAAICSRLFYEEGRDKWKRLMLNSYLGANATVTAVAMEQRYAHDVYLPAIRKKRKTKTIYEMVLRDRYDSRTGMSGLKSAIKELAFLAESGVKYIYLLGLMENPTDPFDTINPQNRDIDKYAGSFEELEEFIREAHNLGLMVVMDWMAWQCIGKDGTRQDIVKRWIETGGFWLSKGIDGFHIDISFALFPGVAKEDNFDKNISAEFVKRMREINPYTFFIFGSYEKHKELLAVAGKRDAAVCDWECRNCATDALTDSSKLQALTSYLRKSEAMSQDVRDSVIHPGPYCDAFDDSGTALSYQDMNLLYFIYIFMPGYNFISNGEIYGSEHKRSSIQAKSVHGPCIEGADPAKKEVRKRLFSLPALHPNLTDGEYHYLETDNAEHAIGIARFGDDEILIGALNITFRDGWVTFSMNSIINSQIDPADIANTYYLKESFMLDDQGLNWVPIEDQIMGAEDLLNNGLKVHVGPKQCEFIRLKKATAEEVQMMKNQQKGSPARCLKFLYYSEIFSREKSLTLKQLVSLRGYSSTTVRVELDNLIRLGLVAEDKNEKAYRYYLPERLARAPPASAGKAVNSIINIDINGVKVMDLYTIPEDKFSEVNERVKAILAGLSASPGGKLQGITIRSSEELTGKELDKVAIFLGRDEKADSVYAGDENHALEVGRVRLSHWMSRAKAQNGKYGFLIAFEMGEPVGYVSYCILASLLKGRTEYDSVLENLFVTPGRRQRGIGTALINEAEKVLRVKGARNCRLIVEPGNLVAQEFCKTIIPLEYQEFDEQGILCSGTVPLQKEFAVNKVSEGTLSKLALEVPPTGTGPSSEMKTSLNSHILRHIGDGRHLIAYSQKDFEFVVKICKDTGKPDRLDRVSNWWIGRGYELAKERLNGLAVPTMIIDATDGSKKPFNYILEDKGLQKTDLAIIQKKVIPLLERLKYLAEKGRISEVKDLINRYKEFVVSMFRRGVVDTDFTYPYGNCGVNLEDGKIYVFDFGGLDKDAYDVALFFENIGIANNCFYKDLKEYANKEAADYYGRSPIQADDFYAESGETLFGVDLKRENMDTFKMAFPYDEAYIRAIFMSHNLNEISGYAGMEGKGSPAELLQTIRDNNELMAKALNKKEGIVLENSETLTALGIFVPVENKPGYYRFADMLASESGDNDYTKTLINAINGISYQAEKLLDSGSIPEANLSIARQLIKMAIINEINKFLTVPDSKTVWHIIEKGVIPRAQQDSLITQINKMYRDNPDLTEKILIVDDTKLAEEIAKKRDEYPDAIIDTALSDELQLAVHESLLKEKKVTPLIFKTAGDFIQFDGVIAALRALHSEDALPAFLRIYSVMAGEPFKNPPDVIPDDPIKFARIFIFNLPKPAKVPADEIPKLNKRLLELLIAA